MPFCIKCGAEYKIGHEFCEKCGVNLKTIHTEERKKEATRNKNLEMIEKKSRKNEIQSKIKQFFNMVIGLLVAVTILSVVISMWASSGTPTPQVTTPPQTTQVTAQPPTTQAMTTIPPTTTMLYTFSPSVSSAPTKTLPPTTDPDDIDTDNDGIPDSVDPLPNIYGTVTKGKFEELSIDAVLEQNEVVETLTQLMNNYNSKTISTQEFKYRLDIQKENLIDIYLSNLDHIPPRDYEELHSYYLLSNMDYRDSILWLDKFADSKSQSDLNLAIGRAKDGRENMEKAQAIIS